jgi:hypothetical protein
MNVRRGRRKVEMGNGEVARQKTGTGTGRVRRASAPRTDRCATHIANNTHLEAGHPTQRTMHNVPLLANTAPNRTITEYKNQA